MRLTKSVATAVTGLLALGAALVAVAAPAAAIPSGDVLPGAIYWFNSVGPLDQQSTTTQISSGSGTVRPWATLATQNTCPAGTTAMVTFIRVPVSGQPEDEWPQIQLGAMATEQDSAGRFYTTTSSQADRLNKPEVMTYMAAHSNTGTFPFVSVCFDGGGNPLGNFRTTITMSGTSINDLAWQLDSPSCTGTCGGGSQQPATDTTTTVAAAASGADLVLTATVSPSAATGTVTFTDGGATVGSAPVSSGTASVTVSAPTPGNHTYQAAFAPTDAAAYNASTGSISVLLGIDAATGQLVLTVPPAPVVDGALTFSVPFGTPVQLAGARSQDNSRITATAAFPTVTVTDTRRDGLLSHWQVNVQSSDFTGSAGTIGAKYLGWTPTSSATPDAGSPLLTRNGATVASYLDGNTDGLGVSRMLGESATSGRGMATLDAALNLAIPPSTAEGAYTATVTVTLIAE